MEKVFLLANSLKKVVGREDLNLRPWFRKKYLIYIKAW